MADSPIEALVGAAWLAERLDAPDVRVVDATWHLPNAGRDAKAEYAERHIPGAVYFDIDDIADAASPLPHMLPSPETFARRVGQLGLGDGDRIVVYDGGGWTAAPRVWWMFRVFGHDEVAVLDGGLAKWRAEGRPTDDLRVTPPERAFTARKNAHLVRNIEQMCANLTSGGGRWAVQTAIEAAVPVNVLAAALHARFRSRIEGGYADKLLSAMRKQFGGHTERQVKS